MTPEDVAGAFDVSRETMADLEAYVDLLCRWTERINLIAPSTRDDIWGRHIADSLQLLDLAPPDAKVWVDLGSGAGLPALVISMALKHQRPTATVTLIESDQRKAAFLATAAQELSLPARVLSQRIEDVSPIPADVVTARALAPLSDLLRLAAPFCHEHTVCLFPKGARHNSELTAAARDWHIVADAEQSRTDASAAIFKVREFSARDVG